MAKTIDQPASTADMSRPTGASEPHLEVARSRSSAQSSRGATGIPPAEGVSSPVRAAHMVSHGAGVIARARMMNGLQAATGNAKVGRLTVQAKLAVSQPGDPHEREAEHVAASVARSPAPPTEGPDPTSESGPGRDRPIPDAAPQRPVISRLAHPDSADAGDPRDRHLPAVQPGSQPGEAIVQRRTDRTEVSREAAGGDPDGVEGQLEARIKSPSGGRPLSQAMRRDMESGIGADFSGVRVHDTATDRADADRLNAKAFTHGTDIWIGSSGSANDRQLMAHELTHVVQQGGDVRRQPAADDSGTAALAEPEAPADSLVPSPDASDAGASMGDAEPFDALPETSLPASVAGEEPPVAVDANASPDGAGSAPDMPAGMSDGDRDRTSAPASTSPAPDFDPIQTPAMPVAQADVPALDATPDVIGAPRDSPAPTPPAQASALTGPASNLVQRDDDNDDGVLGGLRRRVTSIVDGLRSGWTQVAGYAQSAADAIREQVGGMVTTLTSVVAGALAVLQSTWASITQSVTQITKGFQRQVESALGAVIGGTRAIGDAILRLDAAALRSAWNAVRSATAGIAQRVQQAGQAVYQALAGLWQGLRGRFDGLLTSLAARARELFARMQSVVQGLGQRLSSAWDAVRSRASQLSGVLGGVLDRLRAIVSDLVSFGQRVWAGLQEQWTALSRRIAVLAQSAQQRFAGVQQQLHQRAMSVWSGLTALWSRVSQGARQQVERFLGAVRSFWGRLQGFSLAGVIEKVERIGAFVRVVQQAVEDPDSVMKPYVDAIANTLESGMPEKAIDVGTERLQETSPGQSDRATPDAAADTSVTGVIQRQPTTSGPTPSTTPTAAGATTTRTTATWAEIWAGFVHAIKYKWAHISIWQMVKDMLWSIVWPWPAVGHELGLLFTQDLPNAVRSLFLPRNPFGDFFGFLHDLWTDILHLADLPLAILRRLNNVALLLMGWVTIILTIVGAIGGATVGALFAGIVAGLASVGIAAAPGAAAGGVTGGFTGAGAGFGLAMLIGEAFVISFLLLQGTTIIKTLETLWTAEQTPEEKRRDYGQLADSLIGVGVTLILLLIGWLASKLASSILGFIEGKLPPSVRGAINRFKRGVTGNKEQEGCFVAGTPVQTPLGPVAIEALAPDDVVRAIDPRSGGMSDATIARVFRHTVPELLDIRVGATSVTCSPEHPFWVEGIGWRRAGTLTSNESLRTAAGVPARIESIVRRSGSFTVFNIEVTGLHTYLVSDLRLVVHNKAQKFSFREQLEQAVIEEMQNRPGGETAEAWELTNLDGPNQMANPEPGLGPNQVRYQARFWDDFNAEVVDISVNYDPDTGNFGIIKFASGK